jgi:arsenate reductase-like glutaredoxin family protein
MCIIHSDISFIYSSNIIGMENLFERVIPFNIPICKQNLSISNVPTKYLEYALYFMEESVESVIKTDSTFYVDVLKYRKFPMEEWALIIKKNPFLLKHPIAMHKRYVQVCQNQNDIYKLMLQGIRAA